MCSVQMKTQGKHKRFLVNEFIVTLCASVPLCEIFSKSPAQRTSKSRGFVPVRWHQRMAQIDTKESANILFSETRPGKFEQMLIIGKKKGI